MPQTLGRPAVVGCERLPSDGYETNETRCGVRLDVLRYIARDEIQTGLCKLRGAYSTLLEGECLANTAHTVILIYHGLVVTVQP